MKSAAIVQPEEMQASRELLAQALAGLCGRPIPERSLDIHIQLVRQSWGALRIGRSVVNTPLQLAGKIYAGGLGTHSESEIRFRLDKGAVQLQGLAGVHDSRQARTMEQGLIFAVEAGGRQVWQSGKQRADSAPATVKANLGGAREFTLKVAGPTRFAHANWVELAATLTDGSTLDLCRPKRWLADWQGPCLSFTYGRRPSAELLPRWPLTEEPAATANGIARHRLTRTDPETGLQLVLEFTAYPDFPVIEWVGRLRNTGKRNTPIIENIRSMDVRLPSWSEGILHYNTGDYCAADGYEPHGLALTPGVERSFAPDGGRPTNRAWPYYNLEFPEQRCGVIAVIGWPGQWASRFTCQEDGVHIAAGQELTHFALQPGEEVRTPLSVLLFYNGDHARSQNLWRRWMMAHNMPRLHGELHAPFLAAFWEGVTMETADEQSQIKPLDRYAQEGIQLDYWWMDAGWYPCGNSWSPTGTWAVDRERFPRGLRYIADHARARGVKTLAWFEPERVSPGTWLWREHPEWLLCAGRETGKTQAAERRLLDLGNPEAWQWLVANTCKLIDEEKIDLYRQDFNFDPLPFWRYREAPDRVGMREIRHVEGYLAFWRELRKRYPNMLIDSCAAGGRRNDLETLRLSVPLWKTDYDPDDLTTKQAMHQALYAWVPFFAALVLPDEHAYSFRTNMCPCSIISFNDPHLDWDEVRRFVAEWRRIALYFSGDYYPLVPYTRQAAYWLAWQFDRPDLGAGMIQVFRRTDNPFEAARFRLRGLDPAATYRITNLDQAHQSLELTGQELAEQGLPVTMTQAPQALTIAYAKKS